MRPLSAALLSLALGASVPAFAAEPRLLKDLDPGQVPASSNPRFLGRLGDRAILVAEDGTGNGEPWVSDGTEGGARLLADVCPGPCGSRAEPFGQTGKAVFFTVRPGENRYELWATDGTPAGTRRLLSHPTHRFRPGGEVDLAQEPAEDRLYFQAGLASQGEELWVSDGTPDGTFPLTRFGRGPDELAIHALVPFGAGAIFLGGDPASPQLWGTGGTVLGTRRLLTPDFAAEGTEHPAQLFRAGPYVYFTAELGRLGRELWRTDGTPTGTANVADLVRGPRSLEVYQGAARGSRFLFTAFRPQEGTELWITDGTQAGTRTLTRFTPPFPFPATGTSTLLSPLAGADLGGRNLFVADDGVHGPELWSTDGTPAETRFLKDVYPGLYGGTHQFLSAGSGGRAFFYGEDRAHGAELWVSDGTAAGTRLVRDLCRGACSAALQGALAVGRSLLLSLLNPDFSEQLWRSDGTPAGTFRLSFDGPRLGQQQGIALGGAALFAGGDRDHGRELWRSDLTRGGTRLLADLAAGPVGSGSLPFQFMARGAEALFFAGDPEGRLGLWRSDGSEGGTRLVTPLGTRGEVGSVWADLGQRTCFALARRLWCSDGTAAGTVQVSPPGAAFPDFRTGGMTYAVAAGGRVFFSLSDAEHGNELWASDGTPGGTRLVADLVPGPGSSFPWFATAVGGRVLFTAQTPAYGRELWVSDGTEAGTRLVLELTPGEGNAPFLSLFVGAGIVAHFLRDGAGGPIWRSDGTSAGTFPIFAPAQVPGRARALYPIALVNGQLQVTVDSADPAVAGTYLTDGSLASLRRVVPQVPPAFGLSGLDGKLLWSVSPDGAVQVSDGSLESARALLDRNGDPVVGLQVLTRLGSRLLLTDSAGDELWETDGTPAGTRRIDAVLPRLGDRQFLVSGGRIYFPALDREHGLEPWVLDN